MYVCDGVCIVSEGTETTTTQLCERCALEDPGTRNIGVAFEFWQEPAARA